MGYNHYKSAAEMQDEREEMEKRFARDKAQREELEERARLVKQPEQLPPVNSVHDFDEASMALETAKRYRVKMRDAYEALAKHFWLVGADDWLVYETNRKDLWLANYDSEDFEVTFVQYNLAGEPQVKRLPLAEACQKFTLAVCEGKQPHVAKIVYEPLISKEIGND